MNPSSNYNRPRNAPLTLWGLDATGLHDRFWASRGTQVVRPGESAPISGSAELYLLVDRDTLAIFHLGPLLDLLNWAPSNVLLIRLRRPPEFSYCETPVLDRQGNLLRLQRTYRHGGPPPARLILVRDPQLARQWQQSPDARTARRRLRTRPRIHRHAADADGLAFDRTADRDVTAFMTELVRHWEHPAATIPDLCQVSRHVWAHRSARLTDGIRCIGPVWIGADQHIQGVPAMLGPAAIWDAPASRPAVREIAWDSLSPSRHFPSIPSRRSLPLPTWSPNLLFKRAFDIVFALVATLLTLPFYPLVMLAIWLEDGRPFFFAHRRETLGGREFPCLKFRSMRKDSERIKQQIAGHNRADGPQFFIPGDPRLTRVGRLIRKLNVDEFPQFFNVLVGHMSIVGPRPSPYKENQYCPAWREARLSVRPGITGLWQVMRTRRQGQDFQEWIRYDLEYVQQAGWMMDLRIIWKTILMIVIGKRGGA